jgi:pimeloyl-ACP methyl ester carboxylesterase
MNFILRLFFNIAIGYILICLIAFFLQRKFLYYPDNKCPEKSKLHKAGLVFWPDSEEGYFGISHPKEPYSGKGLIIVFHGNAGTAWQRGFYIKSLKQLGYRILLAEYPGYGGRPGKINQTALLEDAKKTVRLASECFNGPVYLIGESLGCAIAAGMAGDSPVSIKGILLITPWDKLRILAQNIYWFLPVRWLLLDHYDNIRNLSGYSGRIAIAVAENDEIVPKRHGLRLYESISTEKRLWILENCSHNSWPDQVDLDWWREVMEFLS